MKGAARQLTMTCRITLGVLALTVNGCTTYPAFGPDAKVINSAALQTVAAPDSVLPFEIVDVSAATLPAATESVVLFPAAFRNKGFLTSDETVGAGDRLEIRIWEVSEDGLFANGGNRQTVLEVAVSNSGKITVPYAGTLAARGLTTAQLRQRLLERYTGQAIEPEISVTIVEARSSEITILGAVAKPGRKTIASKGARLLDLIALAGGTSEAAWEVAVNVQRRSTSATLSLAEILERPENNVVVMPDDIVNVTHEPRRFAVYGAVNKPGAIEVPGQTPYLAYLLAAAGGLNDRVAETQSVYVFRPTKAKGPSDAVPASVYKFDFSKPDTFLLAGMFRLEASDITYVASSDAADFRKFASIVLSPFLGAASTAVNLTD